ncbi:hypothetical protein T492DRAFT_873609 [Pavlovales sp. CCMP2436]|nr:hypothetical protein T492DRAFT_873609 [Pavlovales sp. CCMP2436]
MPRMDLPAETLESVLAFAEPQDIASALRSCRALLRLDPWRSAFEARWGAPGIELRASVGKMAYLLRDVCELVSGGSALDKARHGACQRALEERLESLAELNRRDDDCENDVDADDDGWSLDGPYYTANEERCAVAQPPDQARAFALEDVG